LTTLAIAAPAAIPASLKITTTTVDTQLEPPPVIVATEENGRASPARHVHGAPLHNVMEEEEEQ
jgi:hypothetical protein